ncbi:putative nucleoside-diphosphate-sugar epimerase [Sclerotinia borealis F-4128]|uniref:Putative nucleoside-diphosphate-sugar epimerase n=1 Tax=Sclerotinia borealis (strain F-4128) TaxID=1432307 RepID=W9CGJ8_SCLBF|nr:putative nucleoside-diphosphate-sugar epimerase [Sclerotinia borealis F-4128]
MGFKLIVVGSTGFLATEIIKQALSDPRITSVIAIARRETVLPPDSGVDTAKLKSVVCHDFFDWQRLTTSIYGCKACIWTIGLKPSQSLTTDPQEARRICLDYTLSGMDTLKQLWGIHEASPWASQHSFRFIYVSAANAERDQGKKPWILGDLCLLRGETETSILALAHESNNRISACIAKPGHIVPNSNPILDTNIKNTLSTLGARIAGVPTICVTEMAAALLHQAVVGTEGETLLNGDLVRIGRKVLGDLGESADGDRAGEVEVDGKGKGESVGGGI